MPTDFLAEDTISPELAVALMTQAPANPFCAKPYAEVMAAHGCQPWVLGTQLSGRLIAGCYGFLVAGRLNSMLRIPSLPDVPPDDPFWEGLKRFCVLKRVTYLDLRSTDSSGTIIPPLLGRVDRYERYHEYVLELQDSKWESGMPRNHRRNLKKATETGVTLRRTTSADACREHVRLMAASHERRRHRGELISGDLKSELAHSILLLEKGAGELFQVIVRGEVLSSGLILRAAQGARYHTSGTSLEGMKCGTSHFLFYSIAQTLRSESISALNTGPTESESGLSRFKAGFGARPVPAEEITYYLGSGFRRKVTRVAHFLRATVQTSGEWSRRRRLATPDDGLSFQDALPHTPDVL